jgi:hypothetical protein
MEARSHFANVIAGVLLGIANHMRVDGSLPSLGMLIPCSIIGYVVVMFVVAASVAVAGFFRNRDMKDHDYEEGFVMGCATIVVTSAGFVFFELLGS